MQRPSEEGLEQKFTVWVYRSSGLQFASPPFDYFHRHLLVTPSHPAAHQPTHNKHWCCYSGYEENEISAGVHVLPPIVARFRIS